MRVKHAQHQSLMLAGLASSSTGRNSWPEGPKFRKLWKGLRPADRNIGPETGGFSTKSPAKLHSARPLRLLWGQLVKNGQGPSTSWSKSLKGSLRALDVGVTVLFMCSFAVIILPCFRSSVPPDGRACCSAFSACFSRPPNLSQHIPALFCVNSAAHLPMGLEAVACTGRRARADAVPWSPGASRHPQLPHRAR
jgi:hypothetical protein